MPASGSSSCLDEVLLETVAGGRPVDDAVRRHTEACPACRAAIDEIRANNLFLAELRPSLRDQPLEQEEPLPSPGAITGYRILRRLHRGGQSVVYEAVQDSTQQTVAIKVLSEGPFAGAHDRLRLEREVRILAQLRHPNIVTIHDSGIAAGSFFLVTRFIDGLPLDEYLRERSPSIEQMLCLFTRICNAVAAAHLRGVIHRDIKPSNILVDDDGEPHVLDFGLAKTIEDSEDMLRTKTVTATGQFVGSLPWASPEQADGIPSRIDMRTDVYSLGVILYQMLTGRFPYDVRGPVRATLDNIIRAEPTRPGSIRRHVNHELDTIALKALAKDRQRRYQSVEALRQDVQHYLSGEPIDARRASTWYVLRKAARRYRVPLSVAAMFLVLGVGFAVDRWQRARRLEAALSDANIERGRTEARAGNTILAEELLWREHLNPPAAAGAAVRENVWCYGGSPYSYWALRELYARQPRRFTWVGHDDGVNVMASSPDGSRIATYALDHKLKVWELPSGRLSETLDPVGAEDRIALCFAPDGRRLAYGGADGVIRIRNLADDRESQQLVGHQGVVWSAAFVPDGTLLASAGIDQTIRLWNLASGRCERVLDPLGAVTWVRCSPNGKFLAAMLPRDHRIALYSLVEDRWLEPLNALVLAAVDPPRDSLNAIEFSGQGDTLAAAFGNRIALWNVPGPGLAAPPFHNLGNVDAIDFSPDGGWLAVVSRANLVTLWELKSGKPRHAYALDGARRVRFAPAFGALVTTDAHGSISLWDTQPDADRRVLNHRTDVHCARYSPDGAWLASCGGGEVRDFTIRVWDAATGRLHRRLTGHTSVVSSIAFSPVEPLLASASYDSATIRLWNLETGGQRTIGEHQGGVAALDFSPDGRQLASSSDATSGTVRLWDVETGACLRVFREHTNRIPCVAFSPDGSLLASGSSDETIVIRDVQTKTVRAVLPAGRRSVRAICFTPDGRTLFSGGDDKVIRIWDVGSGRKIDELHGHQHTIYGLSISADGQLLASAGPDRAVKIWHIPTRRFLANLEPTGETLFSSVSFAPDGRSLAAGNFRGNVLVWDLFYYDRHIAGNLEYRLSTQPYDATTAAGLRQWAARVQANHDEGER